MSSLKRSESEFVSPSPAPSRPFPALLRCTSTPISASVQELNYLLGPNVEAHISMTGLAGSPAKSKSNSSRRSTRLSPSKSKSLQNVLDLSDHAEDAQDSGVHTMSVASSANASLEDTVILSPCSTAASPDPSNWMGSGKKKSLSKSRAKNCSKTKASKFNNVSFHKPGEFEHKEKLDFLRHALDMNLTHVVAKVLSYLTDQDLCSVSMTSRSWNASVLMNPAALHRKDNFLKVQLANRENNIQSHRVLRRSPRRALQNLVNINLNTSSPQKSSKRERETNEKAIVSPSKYRFQLFSQEASKLSPGERLQPCPRCTSPCRVTPTENKAKCSRRSCDFQFCTRCMCEVHENKPCRGYSGKKLGGLMCSKKSKSRLKRL